METLVTGLSGRIGSGKTSISEYLVTNYNFTHLSFVDAIFSRELRKRGMEISRKNLQLIGKEMYFSYGEGLTSMLLDEIESIGHYVIDDIRYPTTAQIIRSIYTRNFSLIYVVTSVKTRYERVTQTRGENIRSFEEFLKIDTANTERHIDEVKNFANHVLSNEGSLQELYFNVDRIISGDFH